MVPSVFVIFETEGVLKNIELVALQLKPQSPTLELAIDEPRVVAATQPELENFVVSETLELPVSLIFIPYPLLLAGISSPK
jgi:hypothetical protein